MANHNVFLKYDGSNLLWSSTIDGNYEKVERDTLTFTSNGGDTVTFEAVEGIDKIQKIDDGLDGTKKMIKLKRGEDSAQVIATIIDKTIKGEIDKYSIKFRPAGGGQSITIDPQGSGGGAP